MHTVDDAFLAGWRLLEFLTGASERREDRLIERAAIWFEDFDHHRLLGRHLRKRRNDLSHGKLRYGGEDEVILFQLKNLIEPLMLSFVANYPRFETKEEFWTFCDLPRELHKRKSLERVLRTANDFHSRRAGPK